jgi:acyl-CoA synthetase (AMP-forming)/AMP-acid ligase II
MNIGTLIPRHARYRPDHLAVVFEDQRLTYAQFGRRVNRLAHVLLGLGVDKGAKIATILPNGMEILEIYWAVAQVGAVVVPLSPMLRGTGLARLLNDSDSVALITNRAFVAHLDPVRPALPGIPAQNYLLTDMGGTDTPGYVDYHALTGAAPQTPPAYTQIDDDDPYNIIYSSGTTGLPKGIVHTHQIRSMYGQGFAAAYRITPESVILHTGSLVFNGAFLTFMPAFFQGATYILHPQFDPVRMIDTIAQEQVTHIMTVPSQVIALLHAPNFSEEAMSSLEMICSVGAPLHREHKEALIRRLPDRFYELYGLTEGFVTILDKTDVPAKLDSVGCPPPLYEMYIADDQGNPVDPGVVGEIVGRGPITMPGYYKRPDLTAKTLVDGWIHTGDLGYTDEEGYLYLVDRQKDLIISGGVNVYPRDIEEIIVQHPAVREAAVFGVPSERWGESPLAMVILHGTDAVSADDLRGWINQQVEARYQQVSKVIIVADFPRSVAGKTLKRVMREPFWKDQDTNI